MNVCMHVCVMSLHCILYRFVRKDNHTSHTTTKMMMMMMMTVTI